MPEKETRMNEPTEPVARDYGEGRAKPPRPRLLIHIGPHKTGTTSIQKFLHENRSALLAQGILYPCAGRCSRGQIQHYHHPLVKALVRQDAKAAQEQIFNIHAEIAEHSPSVVVLSSEVFARPSVNPAAFAAIRDAFAEMDRQWIVYLRRQDDLLVSLYAEYVKRDKLRWPRQITDLDQPKLLDHHARLQRFESMLGGDPLIVRSFELDRKHLVGSFLALIGAQGDPGLYRDVGTANESLPLWILRALRYANALPRPVQPTSRRLVMALNRRLAGIGLVRGKAAQALDPMQRARIRARYAESNTLVERDYFGGLRSGLND